MEKDQTKAILELAQVVQNLGIGDATPTMGAIEYLAKMYYGV